VQRPDNADASQWLADPARIRDALAGRGVDFIVDAGLRAVAPSTVVDLSGAMPRLLRRGKGDWCVRAPARTARGACALRSRTCGCLHASCFCIGAERAHH
jgi:hypothetical protein